MCQTKHVYNHAPHDPDHHDGWGMRSEAKSPDPIEQHFQAAAQAKAGPVEDEDDAPHVPHEGQMALEMSDVYGDLFLVDTGVPQSHSCGRPLPVGPAEDMCFSCSVCGSDMIGDPHALCPTHPPG